MTDDALTAILSRMDNLQDSINRIDRDLELDRRDIQQLSIRVGNLTHEVEETRKLTTSLPKRTQERVETAVQPMMAEAKDLKEVIKKKKVLIIKDSGRNFFQKLWNWFTSGFH